MKINEITDTLNLPSINVGDEIRVGKFKNRKAEVTGFDKDEHNQPVLKTTKGDQKLFKPRISKLMVDNGDMSEETTAEFNESLDNPYPIRWSVKNDNLWYGHAKEDDFYNQIGIEISDKHNSGRWTIRFKVGEKMDKTGEGDQFRIFATVVDAIKEWWNWANDTVQVDQITFSAEKILDNSRSKLYNRFAKQFANAIGYNFEVVSGRATDIFYLKNPNLEENFADGKVKGKSRPGRVKAAGASCDGSVTELRKKAKNASGEKQKMYHWCANMKAGKK